MFMVINLVGFNWVIGNWLHCGGRGAKPVCYVEPRVKYLHIGLFII